MRPGSIGIKLWGSNLCETIIHLCEQTRHVDDKFHSMNLPSEIKKVVLFTEQLLNVVNGCNMLM